MKKLPTQKARLSHNFAVQQTKLPVSLEPVPDTRTFIFIILKSLFFYNVLNMNK